MAGRALIEHSQEEVLDQAARLVAGTINPVKMELSDEQVDVENFIKYFKEAATQLLYHKEVLTLAIGPYVNTESLGIYSNDMLFILNSIEEAMHTTFHFYYGISLLLAKNDLYAVWLPH